MNIITQARKDIRFITSVMRGLTALDEELERAGSVETLIREREELAAALEAKVARLHAEIGDMEARRAEAASLARQVADHKAWLTDMRQKLGATA